MSSRQIKLNLPGEIMEWVERESRNNVRSKTAEIIFALKEKMNRDSETKKADAPA